MRSLIPVAVFYVDMSILGVGVKVSFSQVCVILMLPSPVLQALHKAVLDSWEEKEADVERLRDRIQYIGELIHWGLADLALNAVES